MTRITEWDFICPNCTATFQSRLILSTTLIGPTHTDFYRHTVTGNPAQFSVHSCHQCGFSGDLDAFEGTVSQDIGALIAERLPPLTAEMQASKPWLKFDHAAQIAIWSGAPFQQIADLFLGAARVCQDHDNPEEERGFRANAADFLTMAVVNRDFDPDGLPRATYLVGELYRRAGDLPKAREWLNRAEALARPLDGLGWLADLAARQRDDPGEYIER